MSTVAILTIVACLTYSFEIIFGAAGTVLLIPIMSFFLPEKTLIVYAVLPITITAAIALTQGRHEFNFKFFGKMMVAALLGAAIGITIFNTISDSIFQKLIGAFVILTGVYLIVKPQQIKLPKWSMKILDFFGGISGALFSMSSPIVMTRLISSVTHKTAIRNYSLAFGLPIIAIRIADYTYTGAFTPEILRMMYISAPFLVIVLWFSQKIHVHVNNKLFHSMIAWIVFFGGTILFFK